jgi:hypothetical protein
MTKWEYMTIALFEECKKAGTTDQKMVLDKYGDEEWELISVAAIGIKNRFDIVAYSSLTEQQTEKPTCSSTQRLV